jgi:hypothetical protein
LLIAWILAISFIALRPGPSFGWGDGGHMAVAVRAWDEMKPETRAAAVRLLKQHPRYKVDLAPRMPAGLSSEDQDLWLFAFSATWPDYVWKIRFTSPRDFKQYFHAGWHVIGEQVSLDPTMQGTMPVMPHSTSTDLNSLNIRDALPLVTKDLSDGSLSPAQRAVALCWVLHLTGDLHEPCHAASLFSNRFKAPDGDHVATQLPVVAGPQKSGLHQYWDSLYCNSTNLDVLKKWDADQLANPALQRSALPQLVSHPDVDGWVAESFAFAKESVYTKEVRDAVSQQDADPSVEFKPIVLSDDYMARAREIGRERGVLAGLRLADTLEKAKW